MTFSWQTEDNENWDGAPDPAQEQTPRRHIWPLLLLLTLIGAGGLLAYRQATSRINETSGLITQDVRASARLLQQAIARNDLELFHGLLSGRDPFWADAQQALFAADLLQNRAPLGLDLAASTSPEPEITLSPDLREAAVTYTRTFVTQTANGVTQTVQLRQTMYYGQGNERWLLVPPQGGADRAWAQSAQPLVTVHYPLTEAVWGERLAGDLQAFLADLCRHFTLCPPAFHLQLLLDPSPNSLLQLNRDRLWLDAADSVTLPAPSLVGIPADETGYQAIYRAYASRLYGVAVSTIINYTCCERSLFYRALLDLQRQQMGLTPPPLTQADYRQALYANLGFGQLVNALSWQWSHGAFFSSDETTYKQALLLLDFLLSAGSEGNAGTDLYPAILFNNTLAHMVRSVFPEFDENDSAADGNAGIENAWLQHLLTRANLQQAQPPIPWPNQALALLCTPDLLPAADVRAQVNFPYALYRYDLDQQTMRPQSSDVFLSFEALPDDSGLLLTRLQIPARSQAYVEGEDSMQFPSQWLRWQGGVWQTVFESGENAGYSLESIAPGGHYAALYNYYTLNDTPGSRRLLDLTRCDAAGCATASLGGTPIWSPDGRHYLVYLPDHRLRLGQSDAGTEEEISAAYPVAASAIAWLVSDTFAYVSRPNNNAYDELIMLQNAGSGETHPLIPATAFLQLVGAPDYAYVRSYFLGAAPADPDRLIVGFAPQPLARFDEPSYIAAVDRQTGTATLLLTLTRDLAAAPNQFHFTPDGRWLAFITYASNQEEAEVTWYDPRQGRQFSLPISAWYADDTFDWSADGNWLVKAGGTTLLLTAPAYNYAHILLTGVANCSRVAWLNP